MSSSHDLGKMTVVEIEVDVLHLYCNRYAKD